MPNTYFQFKQFTIQQERCAMKVTTDACLFGAWVSAEIKKDTIKESLLDIGTGTGLLSLIIAQHNPQLNIDAIEVDSDAAKQAEENINDSPWKSIIKVFNQDINNYSAGKKYDVIISNPPFYENELQSENTQKNIAHHSSELTLNGLLYLIKLNLSDTGTFYLLLPYKRNIEIDQLLKENELYATKKIFLKQTILHNYFRIIIKGSLKTISQPAESEISIKDDKQQYTEQFIGLLKDYYLYL